MVDDDNGRSIGLGYYGEEAPEAIRADTSVVGAIRGILGI